MTHELETTKEVYSALNRNDTPAAMKLFAANAVRIEFEGSPNGGTYRGIEVLSVHFATGRGTWAEGSCTPEKMIVSVNKIVVLVYVKVCLKKNSEWVEGHVADGFAFSDGKITEMHSFFEKQKAFDWAGIKDEN